MQSLSVCTKGILASALFAGWSSNACARKERVDGDGSPHATSLAASGASAQPNAVPDSPAPVRSRENTVSRDSSGCYLSLPDRCSPDEHCKSQGRWRSDCPDSPRGPGQPNATPELPPGKADWIRIHSWLLFDSSGKQCSYQPEWFCSPPGQDSDCTRTPPSIKVACTRDDALGTIAFESFVYTDVLGACREIAAATCKQNERGLCDLSAGRSVPCEDAGSAKAK